MKLKEFPPVICSATSGKAFRGLPDVGFSPQDVHCCFPDELRKKRNPQSRYVYIALRVAISVGPAGTCAGVRIGNYFFKHLGEQFNEEPKPPKSVGAEIRLAHRFRHSSSVEFRLVRLLC